MLMMMSLASLGGDGVCGVDENVSGLDDDVIGC